MVWLSGRDIARDTIQIMLDASYADAWRLLHDGSPGYTFPTWDPHVRLDYCFAPSGVAIESCEVVRGIAAAKEASDHFPLLSVIATP